MRSRRTKLGCSATKGGKTDRTAPVSIRASVFDVMHLRRLQVAELRQLRFPRIGQPHLYLHLSHGVVSFSCRRLQALWEVQGNLDAPSRSPIPADRHTLRLAGRD